MADAWSSFRSCGSPAFFILFLTVAGVVGLLSAIGVAFAVKSRRFAIIVALAAVVIGTATMAAGAVGQSLGRSRTDEALGMMSGSSAISRDTQESIREEGYHESAQCLTLGLGGGALPFLIGAICAVAAFLRKSEDPPSRNPEG